jgi:hypothetical protein
MNMMFPAYLLLSLDILLATLVVELVSIGLALYLLSASIYGLCHETIIILSFLYALPLKRIFWFDMVTVELAYYTWSRAHLHIANGFLTDEIIWISLASHRHHDGTPLDTTILELLGSTFFALWKFHW